MQTPLRTVDSRWVVTPRIFDFSKRGIQTFEQVEADVQWMTNNNLWFHPRDFPDSFPRRMRLVHDTLFDDPFKAALFKTPDPNLLRSGTYKINIGEDDSEEKLYQRVCSIFGIQSINVAKRFVYFADRLSSGAPDKTVELEKIGALDRLLTGKGVDAPLNVDLFVNGINKIVKNEYHYSFGSREFKLLFMISSKQLPFFLISLELVLLFEQLDWEEINTKSSEPLPDKLGSLLVLAKNGKLPLDHTDTEELLWIDPEYVMIAQLITMLWLTAIDRTSVDEYKSKLRDSRATLEKYGRSEFDVVKYDVYSRSLKFKGFDNDTDDDRARIIASWAIGRAIYDESKLQNRRMLPYSSIINLDNILTDGKVVCWFDDIVEICLRSKFPRDPSNETFDAFFGAVFPRPIPRYTFGLGASVGSEKLFGSEFGIEERNRPFLSSRDGDLPSSGVIQLAIRDSPLLRWGTVSDDDEKGRINLGLLKDIYSEAGRVGQILQKGIEYFGESTDAIQVLNETDVTSSDFGISRVHVIALSGFVIQAEIRFDEDKSALRFQ